MAEPDEDPIWGPMPEHITLTAEDVAMIVDAMENPKPLTPAMLDAIQTYNRLFRGQD